MVTAHVGARQVTNLLARQQNMEITTVLAEESNPSIRTAMRRLREAFGVYGLPTNAGVGPLRRELKDGNSMGLATDTRLDAGESIPFLGVDALTNTSAARLPLGSRHIDARQRRALALRVSSHLSLRAHREPEPGCRDGRPGEGNGPIDQ